MSLDDVTCSFIRNVLISVGPYLVVSTPQCYYGRVSTDVTEITTMTSNIFKRGLWNHRWIKPRSEVKTYIGLHDYYIKVITEQYINYVH
ncbi:unnamed protein product [Timema podura]|uniref:Uncharacterized protein n=1 Tax=Timema podura TaxID=61482 RepID=A0ABN7PEC8_TIMPD|nr:unnamed protein product [Timema podura]